MNKTTNPSRAVEDFDVLRVLDPRPEDAVAGAESVAEKVEERNGLGQVQVGLRGSLDGLVLRLTGFGL